jgi:hypothetical protein
MEGESRRVRYSFDSARSRRGVGQRCEWRAMTGGAHLSARRGEEQRWLRAVGVSLWRNWKPGGDATGSWACWADGERRQPGK